MCRVTNKRHIGLPARALSIGRGSKWGNPFVIGRDGDRVPILATADEFRQTDLDTVP